MYFQCYNIVNSSSVISVNLFLMFINEENIFKFIYTILRTLFSFVLHTKPNNIDDSVILCVLKHILYIYTTLTVNCSKKSNAMCAKLIHSSLSVVYLIYNVIYNIISWLSSKYSNYFDMCVLMLMLSFNYSVIC